MKEGAAFVRAIAAVALVAVLASVPAWASSAQAPRGFGIVVEASHPLPLPPTTTTRPAVRPLAGQPHEDLNTRHPGAGVASGAADARASALNPGEVFAPKSVGGGASRIAELRAKVGDLQEAWHAYQARPDSAGYSLARWKRSVDTLRMNFKQGRLGQTLSGLPGEAFETPYGWRFVDVAPATEVKTGYATLSKFVRRQILKDVWLRRNVAGYTPLWEFRGTASAPLLERLRTFGIPYRFQ